MDEFGKLSVTGIMNYLQDCSTFQSEDLKLGLSYLYDKKRAWWLNTWQILIDRCPGLGERIKISTWPYEMCIRDRGGTYADIYAEGGALGPDGVDFREKIGIETLERRPGYAKCEIKIEPWHLNVLGVIRCV